MERPYLKQYFTLTEKFKMLSMSWILAVTDIKYLINIMTKIIYYSEQSRYGKQLTVITTLLFYYTILLFSFAIVLQIILFTALFSSFENHTKIWYLPSLFNCYYGWNSLQQTYYEFVIKTMHTSLIRYLRYRQISYEVQ